MFIRKSIIDRGILALKDKHPEIISNNIFGPRVVPNLLVKLLKNQYPSDEAKLGILLLKEMLGCRMVSVYNYFGVIEIWANVLHCIIDCKQLLLGSGVVLLSLIQRSTSIVDDHGLLVSTLPQNCPHHMVVGITHDLKGEISI